MTSALEKLGETLGGFKEIFRRKPDDTERVESEPLDDGYVPSLFGDADDADEPSNTNKQKVDIKDLIKKSIYEQQMKNRG